MALYINDASTWKQVRNVYVNDAGTWKDVKQIYVNDAGTWKSVFSSTFMPDFSTGRSDGGTPAEVSIDSTGSIRSRTGASLVQIATWTTDASSASDYEIFVTVTSGSFSSGDATGVWLNLGTSRSWTRGASAGTTQAVTFTVRLRRVSTGEDINTATCGLECSR